MKYVRDTTGRFAQRPYYDPIELDQVVDQLVSEFMQERFGQLILPIPTDALTKLIERDAADLDLYADLSSEGQDVEGVTYFIPNEKPSVGIAQHLSEHAWAEHRLRTTLAHEYGHVKFHASVVDLETRSRPEELLANTRNVSPQKCQRSKMVNAPNSDWMEWQAGYICAALLLPAGALQRLVSDYFERHSLFGPLNVSTPVAGELVIEVAQSFDVSQEAARIRLLKRHYLTEEIVGPSLFG